MFLLKTTLEFLFSYRQFSLGEEGKENRARFLPSNKGGGCEGALSLLTLSKLLKIDHCIQMPKSQTIPNDR